jgi:hypothetical protein
MLHGDKRLAMVLAINFIEKGNEPIRKDRV